MARKTLPSRELLTKLGIPTAPIYVHG